MRNIIFLVLIFWASNFADAQINRVIEYESSQTDARLLPVGGKFEFEELPRPLTTTKVDFTMEAQLEQEQDWTIILTYSDRAAKVLSDTLFYWPGPHKKGDQFTGFIEFIPLVSGISGMSLSIPDSQYYVKGKQNLQFDWCIDEDGTLIYLGKYPGIESIEKDVITTTFFIRDSVVIEYGTEQHESELFYRHVVIKPIPRIGQISRLRCYLKSNKTMSADFKAEIDVFNIDVVQPPDKFDMPIVKGQEHELEIDFIPRAIRAYHKIQFHFENCDPQNLEPYCSQHFGVYFFFNEDGSLRYISDSGFGYKLVDQLPANYPEEILSKKIITKIKLTE